MSKKKTKDEIMQECFKIEETQNFSTASKSILMQTVGNFLKNKRNKYWKQLLKDDNIWVCIPI